MEEDHIILKNITPEQMEIKNKRAISVIIPAKNESELIVDALRSVSWCDKIIHVDNGSTDSTIKIVQRYKGETVRTNLEGFDERKNLGLSYAKTPWVLFLDADERITPLLRQEIINIVSKQNEGGLPGYEIPRKNIYLGKPMSHGGWGNDYVVRLFRKSHLHGFAGHLHEQPRVEGEIGRLANEMIHISHRDLESMVEKTIVYTEKESALRFKAQHPKLSTWRFFRVMITEFVLRFVKLKAPLDGVEGVIDGIFQIFNMYVIYARLYELQIKKI